MARPQPYATLARLSGRSPATSKHGRPGRRPWRSVRRSSYQKPTRSAPSSLPCQLRIVSQPTAHRRHGDPAAETRRHTKYNSSWSHNGRYRHAQTHRHVNGPWRSTRSQRARESCPACPLTWDFTLERVTGIEPALSAWEVCGAVRLSPADSVTCGDLDGLSVSDRDYPRALLPSGT